jgi:nucleoid-associated protein YgaU
MMSQNSTRLATGNLTIRVVIWLLALVATAGAVLSIDRVLRNRSADEDAGAAAVILPPPSRGEDRNAKAAESATETVAGVTAAVGVGNEARSDSARRDGAGRSDGAPAFDIARVEPSGDTVIAGRATPGATVELLRNGRVHDRVIADASGQFAMVPPRLPAGESELTLRSTPRDGAPAVSKQTVVVAVQPNLKDQPVVALMTPDKPSVVLSKPPAPDASTGSVVVETVEAEPSGRKLFVTGHSVPGALVRLYLNDSYHSTATADGSGRVAFTAASDGAGGDYRVRLDEVDRASGVIKSRAEVPFTAPPAVATAAVPGTTEANAAASNENVSGASAPGLRVQKGQTMMVSRGDSLWRISRSAYGDGARYTVIYDANHNQIRNPNRIYPGQIFMIPGGKTR